MKDKSHKSKHHSKEDSHRSDHISSKYKNVLKEKHYKEISNSNREDDKPNKVKSSHKDHKKHNSSPDRSKKKRENHKSNGNDVDESYEELSRRKRRIEKELQALDLEEAAKKNPTIRKIREQLHELDVQEAAAKKSANQVSQNTTSVSKDRKKRKSEKDGHASDSGESAAKKSKPEQEQSKHLPVKTTKEPVKTTKEPVRIKEEPLSDDDRRPPKVKSSGKSTVRQKDEPKPSTSEENETWGRVKEEAKKLENKEKEKEKPNFEVSGKLAEDTNVYNGVVIKYNEPSEARKPKRRWRLYPFKGDSDLPFIPIHRQSAYLFGRTRSIADIPIDHPSCSKQHAVLQYRLVPYKRDDGTTGRRVRPYIIDLESSNKTFVNSKPLKPRCYVELMEKDVIKFGYSSREYVILHEDSKNDEDDDVLDSD